MPTGAHSKGRFFLRTHDLFFFLFLLFRFLLYSLRPAAAAARDCVLIPRESLLFFSSFSSFRFIYNSTSLSVDISFSSTFLFIFTLYKYKTPVYHRSLFLLPFSLPYTTQKGLLFLLFWGDLGFYFDDIRFFFSWRIYLFFVTFFSVSEEYFMENTMAFIFYLFEKKLNSGLIF